MKIDLNKNADIEEDAVSEKNKIAIGIILGILCGLVVVGILAIIVL